MHIVEENGIRTVTYEKGGKAYISTFDGANIRLTEDEELIYESSISAQISAAGYENELIPKAAAAPATISKTVEGYSYKLTTCEEHATYAYCKIPKVAGKSFTNIRLDSTTMLGINNFISAVNKISKYYYEAKIYYSATDIAMIIALCISNNIAVGVAIAILGLAVTGATAVNDMFAAMDEADLAFMQIY